MYLDKPLPGPLFSADGVLPIKQRVKRGTQMVYKSSKFIFPNYSNMFVYKSSVSNTVTRSSESNHLLESQTLNTLSIYTVRTIRPFKLIKWKAKRSALVNVSTRKFGKIQNKVRFGRTNRSDSVNGKSS